MVDATDVTGFLSIEKFSIIGILAVLLWIVFKRLENAELKREEDRDKYIQELKELKKETEFKYEMLSKDMLSVKEDFTQAVREFTLTAQAINENQKEVKRILDRALNKLDEEDKRTGG